MASSACAVPVLYTIGLARQDNHVPAMEFLDTVNGALFMVFGSVIGYPIASASGDYYSIGFWVIPFEDVLLTSLGMFCS